RSFFRSATHDCAQSQSVYGHAYDPDWLLPTHAGDTAMRDDRSGVAGIEANRVRKHLLDSRTRRARHARRTAHAAMLSQPRTVLAVLRRRLLCGRLLQLVADLQQRGSHRLKLLPRAHAIGEQRLQPAQRGARVEAAIVVLDRDVEPVAVD